MSSLAARSCSCDGQHCTDNQQQVSEQWDVGQSSVMGSKCLKSQSETLESFLLGLWDEVECETGKSSGCVSTG